jgi:hypothetical protein
MLFQSWCSILPQYTRNALRVTLSVAVYRQSVRIGGKPLETTTNIFFQLNNCFQSPYVTSSLTRGWVCRLQLLLVLATSVILRSQSRGIHDHILLTQIRDFLSREGQEQGGSVITPGTGFPFCCLLRLAGLRWRYSIQPPHGIDPTHLSPGTLDQVARCSGCILGHRPTCLKS